MARFNWMQLRTFISKNAYGEQGPPLVCNRIPVSNPLTVKWRPAELQNPVLLINEVLSPPSLLLKDALLLPTNNVTLPQLYILLQLGPVCDVKNILTCLLLL